MDMHHTYSLWQTTNENLAKLVEVIKATNDVLQAIHGRMVSIDTELANIREVLGQHDPRGYDPTTY